MVVAFRSTVEGLNALLNPGRAVLTVRVALAVPWLPCEEVRSPVVAVPVAAAIGVVARFAVEQYLDSRLYQGQTHRDAASRADVE